MMHVERVHRYNSNKAHQHEVDDMLEAMEPLLFQYGTDVVFAGHVHAYERMYRTYRCSALAFARKISA